MNRIACRRLVWSCELPLLFQERQAGLGILRDLIASGKGVDCTGAGFTGKVVEGHDLPALELLTKKSTMPGKGPRILVLAPTRELAGQIVTALE